jgi:hypothetical protein
LSLYLLDPDILDLLNFAPQPLAGLGQDGWKDNP